MSKRLKRLELRLPVDHPVWNLPNGSRATIVREWLEFGRRLSEIESELKGLKKLLNLADSGIGTKINTVIYDNETTEQGFDKDTFLNHFK